MTATTATQPAPAKVLIVDDHPAVRDGLAMCIDAQPDMKVCGQAADVAEALRLATSEAPDAAVVDISLKCGNGIDLVKRLKGRAHSVRVLVCSMHDESLFADRALRAGALGYITKQQATEQIIEALRRVLAGKMYLSPEMSEQLLRRAVGGTDVALARDPLASLSDREMELFQLLGQGLSTQEIAKRMRISAKTAETYRARIKEKLGLGNGAELLHRAMQWMMTSSRL